MTGTIAPEDRRTEPPAPRRSLLLLIGLPLLIVAVLAITVALVTLPFVLRAGVQQRAVAAGTSSVAVSAENAAFQIGPSADGRIHVDVTGWSLGTPRTSVTATSDRTDVRVTCGVLPWLPTCALRVAVAVPATADLAVTGTNGEIGVRDLRGTIGATTTNGAIRVAGSAGDVRARSVNGRIEVASAASTHITAETVNGRIDLACTAPPLSVGARTVNGAITVRVPGSTTYAVTAQTVNGAVDTSRMRTDPAAASRIGVTTVNGSIQVLPIG